MKHFHFDYKESILLALRGRKDGRIVDDYLIQE